MPFTARPDREIQQAINRDPQVRAMLMQQAQAGAAALEQVVPSWVMRKATNARIVGGVREVNGQVQGFFGVKSSFWHIPEYGTFRMAARPYLRPLGARMFGRNFREVSK